MQKSVHSWKEIKTFWKKIDKMLLVVHMSFLHGKQLLMKLLFENQQIYENLLLGLTLANFTPTRCVKPCLPVFIRVGISIQKRVDSHLDRKNPQLWKYVQALFRTNETKMWNWKLLYNRQREKNDCFSVDGFCSHCNTGFDAMGCFYRFCLCQ